MTIQNIEQDLYELKKFLEDYIDTIKQTEDLRKVNYYQDAMLYIIDTPVGIDKPFKEECQCKVNLIKIVKRVAMYCHKTFFENYEKFLNTSDMDIGKKALETIRVFTINANILEQHVPQMLEMIKAFNSHVEEMEETENLHLQKPLPKYLV